MDGVPGAVRNNGRAMRTLLSKTRQTPDEKMKAIVGMVNNLFQMSKWAEWDISVSKEPETLQSRKLAAPELVHKEGDDKHLYANERLLKQMPVFSSQQLTKATIILAHDKWSKNEAEGAR